MPYLQPLFSLHQPEISLVDQRNSDRLSFGESRATICGFILHKVEEGVHSSHEVSLEAAMAIDPDRVEAFLKPRPPIAGLAMDRVHIMGVLNVTPDSFSDGGRFIDSAAAIEQGLLMIEAGASVIDIGGESTRPGAGMVPIEAELERVIPVIEGLRAKSDVVISIDTRKAAVMEAAASAGANIINDVSALCFDEGALEMAARLQLPVVLMHAQGTPETMQDAPFYNHVLTDVYQSLDGHIARAVGAGIEAEKIIVDPGIGFGKTLDHNRALLNGLGLFHGLSCPVMLGCSRKRFIAALDRGAPVDKRLAGSLAGALMGACQGVQLLRVHDVAETRQALAVWFGKVW